MARPSRPDRVFLVIAATAAFVSTLVFTIAPIYRFRTAGLDDLQLVLVGTVMEAAVFLFEIPTGVVADRWSRKLVGDHRPRRHRRRAADRGDDGVVRRRARRAGGVGPRLHVHERRHGGVGRRRDGRPRPGRAAHGCSCAPAGSGRPARSSPCRCRSCSASTWRCARRSSSAASCRSSLAGWLVRAMGEEHFEPVPSQDRSTWHAMASSAAAGVRVIRASHVLLFLDARAVPGRRRERGVRPLHREVPARPRPAGLAGLVGPDVARPSSAGCRPRSGSSCRGGSSGATPTSPGNRQQQLDRRPDRAPRSSPCSCWR